MYDEILGGPTLTVIGEVFTCVGTSLFFLPKLLSTYHFISFYEEVNDLEVVEEWHIKRWKERQRSARIARLKSLFTVPHCIRALKFPEDSESGSEPRGEV